MGNTCVGPNVSSNGFLQSVTAIVWRTRQREEQLPPPSNSEVNPNSDSKSGIDGDITTITQNTPPEPVKMTVAVAPREPVRIENEKAEPTRNMNRVEEPIIAVNEGGSRVIEHEKSIRPEMRDVGINKGRDDLNNAKKPVYTKRISIAGLQVESVLEKKTINLQEIYSLGRKLGQGQFGTTFLCIRKDTGQEFACKSIAKNKLITLEDVDDVKREIQIMHHLKGRPNVINIVDAYEDDHAVHVVMELCAGGELFDRIIQKGYYTERKAAELTRLIVGVVQTCHSSGVMHRDLKPENFLFVSQEEESPLKTIDFGLSVFFSPDTRFTDVVGSPYYVAPEVLKKCYGPECDVWSAGVIVYILLSGVPPFWAETEQGIFEQVLKGELDFDSDPWPSISESAKDLVKGMLVSDPKQRMTASGVLRHPWVREDGVASNSLLDSAILGRLKHFSALNKFKKIAIHVIAERVPDLELAGMKETFKMIDTDNSGQITVEELRGALERYGTEVKESEIKNLMQELDMDKNGVIDFVEFKAAMLHLNKFVQDDIHVAFSYFDRDSSGFITKEELYQACQQYGLHDHQLEDIIRDVDKNKDGQIDYNEFVAMMRETDIGHQPRLSIA